MPVGLDHAQFDRFIAQVHEKGLEPA